MYIDYSNWDRYDYKVSALKLDPHNPRIGQNQNLNQTQIVKFLIDNFKAYEPAKKIAREGYMVNESPIVTLESNKKIVVEGNRRVAALKIIENPSKFLSNVKAKTIEQLKIKNNIKNGQKVTCIIAPNRIMTSAIIYTRHKGEVVQRWKSGDQYTFVANLHYDAGMSINDISEELSENRSDILKPLKAYNLWQDVKEAFKTEKNTDRDISDFDITNLERFYDFKEGRELLGIEFTSDGAVSLNIDKKEFHKRLIAVIEYIDQSENFSREFNKTEDKISVIEKIKNANDFDYGSKNANQEKSSSQKKEKDTKKEKSKNNHRKRRGRKRIEKIIDPDYNPDIGDDKLHDLFEELKNTRTEHVNTFAILLRTYLEQLLFYYIQEKALVDDLNDHVSNKSVEKRKRQLEKDLFKNFFEKKLKVSLSTSDKDNIYNIIGVKRKSKNDFFLTLQPMLEFTISRLLEGQMSPERLLVVKSEIQDSKNKTNLTIHNYYYHTNKDKNKTMWKHFKHLIDYIVDDLD